MTKQEVMDKFERIIKANEYFVETGRFGEGYTTVKVNTLKQDLKDFITLHWKE